MGSGIIENIEQKINIDEYKKFIVSKDGDPINQDLLRKAVEVQYNINVAKTEEEKNARADLINSVIKFWNDNPDQIKYFYLYQKELSQLGNASNQNESVQSNPPTVEVPPQKFFIPPELQKQLNSLGGIPIESNPSVNLANVPNVQTSKDLQR